MKPAPVLIPVAFADRDAKPQHSDLLHAIGPFTAGVRAIQEWFETLADHAYELKYSPRAGWYEIAVARQRRVYYFIPRKDNFTLNIVIGARAIMSLVGGPHALAVARLLKTAKQYPEGTLFSFTGETLDPAVAIALCRAKLAHH